MSNAQPQALADSTMDSRLSELQKKSDLLSAVELFNSKTPQAGIDRRVADGALPPNDVLKVAEWMKHCELLSETQVSDCTAQVVLVRTSDLIYGSLVTICDL